MSGSSLAQESYNSCSNALELCPNTLYSVNNIGANVSFCPGCEDDFPFCFSSDNTIWFTFTTNALGGSVQLDFSNLVFENNPGQDNELQATIIETFVPCSSGSYVQIGNCVSNATGNFSLNAIGLNPNTTYMVVVDGDNAGAGVTSPAECSFDVLISGTAVDHVIPGITITPNATSICQNDVVFFSASVIDCPDTGSYNWYINGVLAAVTTLPEFQTSTLLDGDIVTVETSCYLLCPEIINVDAVPISVYSFTVDAGADQTIGPGEAVTINGTTTAPDHFWSPAYLFSDPNSLSTIAFPDQTITLSLTATENGCTLSDYITITVTTNLDIPNTFSPNGDNINETWVITGIDLYPNNSVRIYDRWGQEVFQTTGYSKVKTWNGDVRNRGVSEGVFFYVIELGNDEVLNGTVTVIR